MSDQLWVELAMEQARRIWGDRVMEVDVVSTLTNTPQTGDRTVHARVRLKPEVPETQKIKIRVTREVLP